MKLKPFLYGVLIGSVAPAAAVVLSNGSLRSAFTSGVAFALCGCLAFAGRAARVLQWLDRKRIVGSTRATLAPEEASMSGSAPQKLSVHIPGIHTDLTELFPLVNFEVRGGPVVGREAHNLEIEGANPSPAKEQPDDDSPGAAASLNREARQPGSNTRAIGRYSEPPRHSTTPNSPNARRTAHKRTPEATAKHDPLIETGLRNLGTDRATARSIATRLADAPGTISDRLRLAIALAREAA